MLWVTLSSSFMIGALIGRAGAATSISTLGMKMINFAFANFENLGLGLNFPPYSGPVASLACSFTKSTLRERTFQDLVDGGVTPSKRGSTWISLSTLRFAL